MEKIISNLRTGSAEFAENRRKMKEEVDKLRERLARAREGGPPESRKRHIERGKLLVHDRIEKLIDPGTPFLELSPLAAFDMYGDDAPSSGLVTGICRIEGREAIVIANDATVKGGTMYPITVKKQLRAQRISMDNRLPDRLPRRLRRRVPAAAGRDLPRRDPRGTDILQRGGAVLDGRPASRGGDGVVHGGRRLRSRDVRREHHRQAARARSSSAARRS